MDISLSVARLQSAVVRECIGQKGENLRGPLVQKDDIEGGNWVRMQRTVMLP